MDLPTTWATNMPGRSLWRDGISTHSKPPSSMCCGSPNAPAAALSGTSGRQVGTAFHQPQPRRELLRRCRAGRLRTGPQPPVGLRRHPVADDLPERRIVHVADEDLPVLVHALDEQPFQQVPEHELELVFRVHGRGLAQAVVGDRGFDDLTCLPPGRSKKSWSA